MGTKVQRVCSKGSRGDPTLHSIDQRKLNAARLRTSVRLEEAPPLRGAATRTVPCWRRGGDAAIFPRHEASFMGGPRRGGNVSSGQKKSGTTGARHGTQRRSSTNVAGQMVGSRRGNGRRALRAPARSWRCSCLRGRDSNAALSKKAAPNMRGSCCRTLALLFARPLLREPTRNVRCPKTKAWQARGVHQKFLECSGLREVHLGARVMARAVLDRQYSFACGKGCCSSPRSEQISGWAEGVRRVSGL